MIGAVVLAAGRSTRMGTQKLLLPLHGQPIIAGIVEKLRQSPVQEIRVVTGPDGPQIQQALRGHPVKFVQNPDPQGDMLGSVRCGLRALPEACTAVLVVLGDQPTITTGLVRAMIAAFHTPSAGACQPPAIIVPAFQGRRGHPLLFAARYREEILTQHDGVGLRGLLAGHPNEVLEVPASDPGVLEDLDQPADYDRLARAGE